MSISGIPIQETSIVSESGQLCNPFEGSTYAATEVLAHHNFGCNNVNPVSADNAETSLSESLLDSDFQDGHWVNETVAINGTTSINPQNADWVLYNVTDPYVG